MSTYNMPGLVAGADNTAAFNKAISNAADNDVIIVPPGDWTHSSTLQVAHSNITLNGYGARFLGTVPRYGGLHTTGSNVVIAGLTHEVVNATARGNGENFEDCPFSIDNASNVTLKDLVSIGARDASYFISGANGVIANNLVGRNSFADGFHISGGSKNIIADGIRMIDVGDDGVAVVSYTNDNATVTNVRISNILVVDGQARGVSIVGGDQIVYTDVTVRRSRGTGIYIAAEQGSFNTRPVTNSHVYGGQIYDADWDSNLDTGAIGVYNLVSGTLLSNISVEGFEVYSNRKGSGPYLKLGTSNGSGGRLSNVTLKDIELLNGVVYVDGTSPTSVTNGSYKYQTLSGTNAVNNAEGSTVKSSVVADSVGVNLVRVKIQ